MPAHRHEIHRGTRRTPGEFAPLFDWLDEPEETAPPVGDTDPLELLRSACELHTSEREGMIVRFSFGVDVINRRRAAGDKPLTGTYQASNYCDPFGALLHGTPYGAGILPDAARLLGVDELFIVGFLHGLDKAVHSLTGRREEVFEKSASYQSGYEVGDKIAEEFVRIPGGWEV